MAEFIDDGVPGPEGDSEVDPKNDSVVRTLDKDFQFKLGMVFSNEDEAYDTYNAYGFMKGFAVRRGQKYYNRKSELRRATFLCSCEGVHQVDQNKERKILRSIKRCGCLARIRFKIEGGVWEVIEISDKHNHHFIHESQRHLMRSARKITETKGSMPQNLVQLGIGPTKAYSHMVDEPGGSSNVGFPLQDVGNFLRAKRTNLISAGDSQRLLDYFQILQSSGNDLFYSVQVDDENRLTNVFWRDGMSRLDYECFGDVVIFDTTYRSNKYNMICALFVGVNNHWKNVFFGCAFMVDETIPSFIWVFQAFRKAMGNKAPKTIFTDQDSGMSNAICAVFPETVHRLCSMLISKNAKQHISHLLAKSSFKDKFFKVLHCCESEEEIECSWKELYEECGLANNQWLNNLYLLRHKWSSGFNRDTFSAGIRSAQRSESTNNVFKQISCETMTLTEYAKQYEQQAEKMRDKQTLDDFECARGKPKPIAPASLLKQTSEVYTLQIFKRFQAEFIASWTWGVASKQFDEASHTYVMEEENGQREHFVEFQPSESIFKCTCKLFESHGWLCRHVLSLMKTELKINSIPHQYVLKRWTRTAREGISIGDYYNSTSQDSVSPLSLNLKELMRKSFSVMSLSAMCKDTVDIARRRLNELEAEIQSFNSLPDGARYDILVGYTEASDSTSTGGSVRDLPLRKTKGVSISNFESAAEKAKKKTKLSPRNSSGRSINQNTPMNAAISIGESNMNQSQCNYQNQLPASHPPSAGAAALVETQPRGDRIRNAHPPSQYHQTTHTPIPSQGSYAPSGTCQTEFPGDHMEH